LIAHIYNLMLISYTVGLLQIILNNTDKTTVITLTRKNYAFNENYKLCEKCLAGTDYIRDMGVVFDSKLCLHHHVG